VKYNWGFSKVGYLKDQNPKENALGILTRRRARLTRRRASLGNIFPKERNPDASTRQTDASTRQSWKYFSHFGILAYKYPLLALVFLTSCPTFFLSNLSSLPSKSTSCVLNLSLIIFERTYLLQGKNHKNLIHSCDCVEGLFIYTLSTRIESLG
jgi:hypothetical protein